MKNYVISTVFVFLTTFLVLSTFAQPAETNTTTGMGRGARAGSMNTGIRAGSGRNSNTQSQQEAITTIEIQIAKLKTNIEAQAEFRRSAMGGSVPVVTGSRSAQTPTGRTATTMTFEIVDPPQEEIEKMNKLQEEQQALIASIEEQVIVLKGNQFQVEHEAEMSELQEISNSATEENATVTVKLVQELIAQRTQAFQDTVDKLGIRLRSNRRQGQGTGRQGFGATQGFGGGQGYGASQRRGQQ